MEIVRMIVRTARSSNGQQHVLDFDSLHQPPAATVKATRGQPTLRELGST